MKTSLILGLCLAALGGNVMADELADADKFMAAKDYARALPIYAQLAAAGNPAAQFHLGELYWYGEGTAVDMAKADGLFRKAADAGNADARAALQLTPQRQAQKAQIDYYTSQYDGADIRLSKFNCVKPAIPEVSTTAAEIKKTADAIDGWQGCYNGFVRNLATLLPVGKAIPAELTNVMTDEEVAASVARMDKAYASASADAKKEADAFMLVQATWQEKTNQHVVSANARTAMDLERRRAEIEKYDAKYDAMNRDKMMGSAPINSGGTRR